MCKPPKTTGFFSDTKHLLRSHLGSLTLEPPRPCANARFAASACSASKRSESLGVAPWGHRLGIFPTWGLIKNMVISMGIGLV